MIVVCVRFENDLKETVTVSRRPKLIIRVGAAFVGAVVLLSGLFLSARTDAANRDPELELPAVETGFVLHGSHGFSIYATAYANRNGGTIEIFVGRRRESVNYRAPAIVTPEELSADLGTLGRIDVVRHPSGRKREVHPKCLGGSETYEPATYEGIIEFDGEEGYTRAHEVNVPQIPAWLVFTRHAGSCSGGYGESSGPGEHGARLRGVSYEGGRNLSFQVNKNGRHTKALYEAQLAERRNGVRILRKLSGTAPANAFRFDSALRSATLSLPTPFSGSASLTRSRDSFSPLWSGDLKLDFPGRSDLPLAGTGVHVSLVHAHFTRSHGSHAEATVHVRGGRFKLP
jgi:hypothetical protein